MKKLVIFDLDGTLVDSRAGLTESINFALSALHLPLMKEEDVGKAIGEGTEFLAETATHDQGEVKEHCHRLFLEHYTENFPKSTAVTEGIPELLETLKKREIRTALFSNKSEKLAKCMAEQFFRDTPFDLVVGISPSVPRKPSNVGVEKILTELGVKREDAILVGDGEVDAKTAENAGVDYIGALWGNRNRKELKETGATSFAKSPRELGRMILYKYGKKHLSRLVGEFRKFITKGNVLDMAVGVIIGAAFTAIVNSLVKDLINPLVSLITGGISLSELKWVLRKAEITVVDGVEKITKPALTVNYGTFIQAILNFLLVALTVFVIVKMVMAIRKRLDYNENMRTAIQKKLDGDTPLNQREKRWMIKEGKRDKAHLPRKTVKAPPPPPPAPPAPTPTEKLLGEILLELRRQNGEKQSD